MKLLLILILCLLGVNLAKNYAQSDNTFAVKAKTENGIVEGSYDVGENLSMYSFWHSIR